MTRTTLIVLIVLAVLIAVGALLIIRRRRYVAALRSRGWTFESSPTVESVLDHTAPPFGLGFTREVDESVSGVTQLGVPFHVFEYTCREGGPKFDARLASVRLPVALPPVFVTSGKPRTGTGQLPVVDIDQRYLVQSVRPEDVPTVLTPSVLAAIGAFGEATGTVDLSIDGDHLVAVGAPKDPEELEAYLESLSGVALAVGAEPLGPIAVAPSITEFGFFGHPDWVLIDQDDSLIDMYQLTRAGTHHYTDKVLRGAEDGLALDAFVHHWQTTHTEVSTDSQGRTTTRTVTDHHEENVVGIRLPAAWPQLSINGGWGGKLVKFELEEFNDRFRVGTGSAKFASDVIHPRMMEYLLAVDAPAFSVEGQLIQFSPDVHDTLQIGYLADFAHNFVGRVPSFVWRELGVEAPPARTIVEA